MVKQPIPTTVGKRIRAMRKRRQWTIEALAALAQIDPTYLGSVERGQENPTLQVLGRIAHALSCELVTLLDVVEESDVRTLRRNITSRVAKLNSTELRTLVRLLDAIRL